MCSTRSSKFRCRIFRITYSMYSAREMSQIYSPLRRLGQLARSARSQLLLTNITDFLHTFTGCRGTSTSSRGTSSSTSVCCFTSSIICCYKGTSHIIWSCRDAHSIVLVCRDINSIVLCLCEMTQVFRQRRKREAKPDNTHAIPITGWASS